jgi:4-hydroxy-4-methyl-2-oxoglutarate aldolase
LADHIIEPPYIEYLRTVDTPTLSNAIERLGVRRNNEGFAPLGVRCMFPELGRMVGHAVTAHVETCSAGKVDWNKFLELFEAVATSPKPAVVAFQELGPNGEYAAHCGEVMATILTRVGAVGLVSDCSVRDLPEVRPLRFHNFARGAVASHANFRIVRVGIAIQVCGLAIAPGDILHGDENGLLVVPREGLDRLPGEVEAVRTRERALMEFVRGLEFSLQKLRDRMVE